MAKENQNTGPSNLGAGQQDVKRQLREILEDQGDYNNLLKDSIKYIESLDKTYTRIAARISALNRDTINTKQLNQELQRLGQKRFVAEKNYNDIQREVTEQAKELAKFAEENADSQEDALGFLKSAGDLEAIALYTAKQAVKVSEQKYQIGKAELENEKQLNKQIGISGAAFKLFSDKLGIGTEFYEQMVSKARQLQTENKKITFGDKLSILGKSAIAGIKGLLSDPLTAIPLIGGAIAGVVKSFMTLVEFGLQAQDRTIKFGRALGLSANEALRVRNEFSQIAFQSNNVLVNTERLMASQEELTGALGVNNILSKQILETNIQLKELAGLEVETRAEIAKSSIITGQSSDNITKSVLAQVVGLKAATGVSFNYQRILREASNLGGYLGLAFAKYPAQLTKSLVTVKAMGLELKQLDQMADSFLDFESSISKEFEAQLLTGRDINLTKAREAFLNNDLATAAGEITRQVGTANDFLKLNRIQAESLASAFGMSRDQMGEMLKQQELLSKIGAKQGDSAREQLRLGLERYKSQKALAAAVGEEAYQSLVNASSQEKIAAFMDKIKQAIADFVANSPLIPLVERAINWLSSPSNIQKVVSYVQNAFAVLFDIFGSIAGGVMRLLNYLPGVNIDKSLIDLVETGGDNIRAMNLSGAGAKSIGDNVAVQTAGVNMNQIPAANNMAMAAAPEVYVLVSVDPDTGAKVQKRITRDVYERQFGQMTNQYK